MTVAKGQVCCGCGVWDWDWFCSSDWAGDLSEVAEEEEAKGQEEVDEEEAAAPENGQTEGADGGRDGAAAGADGLTETVREDGVWKSIVGRGDVKRERGRRRRS